MFGQRLADERKRLGLRQEELAPSLGLGRSALAAIETDRSPLPVAQLVRLGKDVGVDVLYVLTGESSKTAACKLLDWDLVAAIQRGIAAWCAEHRIVLPPEKQTLVLKILLERFSREDAYSAESLDEQLRLAA